MNISIRAEGGLGDVLMANRFVPAILESNKEAKIDIFLDNENNPMQESALRSFYPHFYNNIITIPRKKYKEFYIDSQFGKAERGFGALENIPDEYVEKMTKGYDKFYDLHIDGLKWTKYDFDWKRYFYFFPKPQIKWQAMKLPPKFALFHLASNNLKSSHTNETWYIQGLLKKMSADTPCLVIWTEATLPYLECLKNISENIRFVAGSLEEIGYIISESSVFIGIDSGLVPLARGLNKPIICYSAQCVAPHQVLLSHKIRWLPISDEYFPVNYDFNHISNLAKNMISNPAYSLVPQLTDFDNQAIDRHYTINKEKSIL